MDGFLDWGGALASWLAALVALVGLIWQVATKRNDDKQAASIEEAIPNIELTVKLVPDGPLYKFVISNISKAVAKKVHFWFPDPFRACQLLGEDIREKSDYPILAPGSSYSMRVEIPPEARHTIFPVMLSWRNERGEHQESEHTVSVSQGRYQAPPSPTF